MASEKPFWSGLFTSLSLLTFALTLATAEIKLVENGYEGVVIAIKPGVDENQALLSNLEDIFTKASALMFQATHNRVYFRKLTIVVPESWQSKPHYQAATDQQLADPKIFIDKPNPTYGDTPYVKSFAQCGKEGLFMHLTPEYVLRSDVNLELGRPEKTIVHEWSHLRWGLFDEYPTGNDEHFYASDGNWLPTQCSKEIKGSWKMKNSEQPCPFETESEPADDCRFYPANPATKAASIMYAQDLDNVVEFCDHGRNVPIHLRHNTLAPNKQNRLCHSMSAWEVMRQHADFGQDTIQLASDTETKPNVTFVQVRPNKKVLVLDTSGSMSDYPLQFMNQVASTFITSTIEEGSWLGIVGFNTYASSLAPLTEVKSQTDRDTLVEKLPWRADGGTSIGAGLLKGIELLKTGNWSSGGTILLITDGEENTAPMIADVQDELLKEGIVVHSIAYGKKAEKKIANLTLSTGGRPFFYSGKTDSTALTDALTAIVGLNKMLPDRLIPVSLSTFAGTVSMNTPFVGTFFIDPTIGRETTLSFGYTRDIKVTVGGPDVLYTMETHAKNFHYNSNLKTLRVSLDQDPTPGSWNYTVTSKYSSSSFTVNIQSKSRNEQSAAIKITTWIGHTDVHFSLEDTIPVFAEILLGQAPLLNLDVLAILDRPTGSPLQIVLKDNGIAPDLFKGDAIYSGSVMPKYMVGDGRYNMKVEIFGDKNKSEVAIGGGGSSSGASDSQAKGSMVGQTKKLEENFQRVTTAGEFRVTGFPDELLNQPVPDKVPPASIDDFVLKSFNYKDNLATLWWTAVGGDEGRGQASEYIIYMSDDFNTMLENATQAEEFPRDQVVSGNLSDPRLPGQKEEYVLHIESLTGNETVFLSVLAKDENGNVAKPSNIISVSPARTMSFNGDENSDDTTGSSKPLPAYALALITVAAVFCRP